MNTFEGHNGSVTSVTITADGKYIVSGSLDNTIKIWDTKTGKCLNTFAGHNNFVNSIITSPDVKYIIVGCDDNKIKVFDFQTGKCINTFENHTGSVTSLAITPDSRYIVSGSLDNTIKILDIKTAKCIYTIDDKSQISIDENGYFISNATNIDKYLRVSEELLSQRKLTNEEINHFRKKDNFLEIGEIIKKPIFE